MQISRQKTITFRIKNMNHQNIVKYNSSSFPPAAARLHRVVSESFNILA